MTQPPTPPLPSPLPPLPLPPCVQLIAGQNNLPCLDIHTPLTRAQLYLHGAHLTHWHPNHTPQPVLWMSQSSFFSPDKPIRGGIPLCFPWFGPPPLTSPPTPPTPPLTPHGWARLQPWTLTHAHLHPDHSLSLSLCLTHQNFHLQYSLLFSNHLSLSLTATNLSSNPVPISHALHTYLHISDIHQIRILGLDHCEYISKTQNNARFTQPPTPITITQETDRVYLNTTSPITLEDPAWNRRIITHKSGSLSTVIWNPWIDKSKAMPDFDDNAWPSMLCIETANALNNSFSLLPNQSHSLSSTLEIQPLTP